MLAEVSRGDEFPPEPSVKVIVQGEEPALPEGAALILEDGGEAEPGERLPLGYHRLVAEDRATTWIVTPGSCYLPQGFREWGWAVQLYAARSRRSWGIGDLGDLHSITGWTKEHGGGVVMVNPLHAVAPSKPQESSPYSPGSRCYRNPLYLRIEDIPGASDLPGLPQLAAAATSLNEARRIDRDAVRDLKLRALEDLWRVFPGDPGLDRYVSERGEPLSRFATYMVLAETHGPSWREWPTDLRTPDSPGVACYRAEQQDRIRFHMWLQWLIEEQLKRAGADVDLIHDLAIGVSPGGADAWMWQEEFATGVTVGAPPDAYNRAGQDWGALAFDPWRLRARGYEPFIETLRSSMRSGGGMRFDHVMGLFRLYWIPEGADPLSGAYVTYPHEELLGILALESHRHSSFVVGEDLGTVEPVVREEMARRRMLSYKLLWFEDDHPPSYPALSLAAPGSHDLPTAAGLWTGEDMKAQAARGMDPAADFVAEMIARLQRLTGVERDAPVAEMVEKSYAALAEAGSALVLGSFEDITEVTERYNSPGTTGGWNWSTALPQPLEEILAKPQAARLAERLRRPPPAEEGDGA
ncbi:MAG: 4-alpha-glucanotransferase [Actinomycetota bacterium]